MEGVPIIGQRVVIRPYKLESPDRDGISRTQLPQGAGFVRVGYWKGDLSVWLLHKTGLPKAESTFVIFRTATMEEMPNITGQAQMIGEVVDNNKVDLTWPKDVILVFFVVPPTARPVVLPRGVAPASLPKPGRGLPPVPLRPIREPGA